MRYRNLGRCGLRVSAVSLGSWLTLGSSVDRAASRAVVRAALDVGIQTFDTADAYARGQGEEALAEALAGVPRHRVVLATKCFFPMSDDPNDRGLSRKHVMESCDGSLRRLRTEYVDLYQAHRDDADTPLDETVRAFGDLVRQGKVLYWGVSCWTGARIAEACRVADRLGVSRPASNQPPYSLLQRGIEPEVIPVCRDLGVGQIVWSPQAQGVLTGKYRRGEALPAGSRAADPHRNTFMGPLLTDAILARVDALRPLADEIGVSVGRLALAWVLSRPGVSSAIVGATHPDQVRENAQAAVLDLPGPVTEALDSLFPTGPAHPGA